jgi:hypothetical protein
MISASARSTSASNLSAHRGCAPGTSRMPHHIRRRLHHETSQDWWARGSFAKLRRRTSAQEVVCALPDSSSAIRFPISASQAACTPSSTWPPRLEIRESANASCSSTDSEQCLLQQLGIFRRHLGHVRLPRLRLSQSGPPLRRHDNPSEPPPESWPRQQGLPFHLCRLES